MVISPSKDTDTLLTSLFTGLPHSQTEVDASKMALAFYCIGSLDLLGLFHEKTKEQDRASWREWIWQQQTREWTLIGPPISSLRIDANCTAIE
ncbi:hypothetical protein C0989_007286 [Termitomyces sp. Mn162]|nr:hypothetical protein C0989_007286 [Termitomyces sp. Mn162]